MQGQYNLRSPAVKRLMREAHELNDPTEQYYAQPLEDNLFEWHFTIRGPGDSDFDGGTYHGRIILPPEYPMKPPSIILLTPNGRFETNKKICLSISGYHPESWQPSWSIRTALLAIIGFMPTHGAGAIGSLDYKPDERKTLAKKSKNWRCPNCGDVSNILKPVTEASKETDKEAKELAAQINFQAEKEKGSTTSDSGQAEASNSASESPQQTPEAAIVNNQPLAAGAHMHAGFPPFPYPPFFGNMVPPQMLNQVVNGTPTTTTAGGAAPPFIPCFPNPFIAPQMFTPPFAPPGMFTPPSMMPAGGGAFFPTSLPPMHWMNNNHMNWRLPGTPPHSTAPSGTPGQAPSSTGGDNTTTTSSMHTISSQTVINNTQGASVSETAREQSESSEGVVEAVQSSAISPPASMVQSSAISPPESMVQSRLMTSSDSDGALSPESSDKTSGDSGSTESQTETPSVTAAPEVQSNTAESDTTTSELRQRITTQQPQQQQIETPPAGHVGQSAELPAQINQQGGGSTSLALLIIFSIVLSLLLFRRLYMITEIQTNDMEEL